MFGRKEKELPPSAIAPPPPSAVDGNISPTKTPGVLLGNDIYWNPESLPNAHCLLIGTSGSGKTQTLKAIALGLSQTYPHTKLVLVDFHGDQNIKGEMCYPLHMKSAYGVNLLVVNLDPEGGGPALQAIAIAKLLKKLIGLGPKQEGLLLTLLENCYHLKGILQEDHETWAKEPPNLEDVRREIEGSIEEGNKDAIALNVKLSTLFRYGIFNRPSFPLDSQVTRMDVSKLPPALQALSAECLARQLLNDHRMMGEMEGKIPRTYLFIDEAKEMPSGNDCACDRIIADGRKYGLGLCVASQSYRHFSKDVLSNSQTKIVLPVDQIDVRRTASTFRFSEEWLAQLKPLTALCRFGKDAEFVEILPYYRRVTMNN